jgi:hypothetical protein
MDTTHLTVLQKSASNYMGRAWFEIWVGTQSTGTQYHALDENHAIEMYHQHQAVKFK